MNLHALNNAGRLVYLKFILKEINEQAKEGNRFYHNRVFILVPGQKWIDELSPHLKDERVPVCTIGEDEDAVILDHMVHARSFEWPVVIVISYADFSRIGYVLFSRAVTRLVIIWIQ